MLIGVVACVMAREYLCLVSGRRIVDFIQLETHGHSQRRLIQTRGTAALLSALGSGASLLVAFIRRDR